MEKEIDKKDFDFNKPFYCYGHGCPLKKECLRHNTEKGKLSLLRGFYERAFKNCRAFVNIKDN